MSGHVMENYTCLSSARDMYVVWYGDAYDIQTILKSNYELMSNLDEPFGDTNYFLCHVWEGVVVQALLALLNFWYVSQDTPPNDDK